MRHSIALAGVVACCALACKSTSSAEAPPASEVPTCDATEHVVGTTCVPGVFDHASLPRIDARDVVKAADGSRFVRARLLVLMKDASIDESAVRALVAGAGGEVIGSVPFVGLYEARFAGADTEAALDAKAAALTADSRVADALRDAVFDQVALGDTRDPSDLESVAPADSYLNYFVSPADPALHPVGATGAWAYEKIGVFKAWDAIFAQNPKTTKVLVALLDGEPVVDPVFAKVPFRNANDARVVGSYKNDTFSPYHATAAAAIIGAPNDKLGMNGIVAGLDCLQYDIMPQTVLGDFDDAPGVQKTTASISAAVMGVVLGVRAGARVVSMSFGFHGGGKATRLASMFRGLFLAAPRVLFVAGAGNDGTDAGDFLPAAAAVPEAKTGLTAGNLMSVAAVDQTDGPAVWPNIGRTNVATTPGSVTIAAPGKDVLTHAPDGGLTMFNGTSSATPVVAGVGALVFAVRPELLGADVARLLVETGDPVADLLGGRRVNAQKAVELALAGVPDARRGFGTCSTPADNVCPIAKGCEWCVSGPLVVEGGAPGAGTFTGHGSLSAYWLRETDLSDMTLNLKGNVETGYLDVYASVPLVGDGRIINRQRVEAKGHFVGAGNVNSGGTTTNFDDMDFVLKFSGSSLSGSLVARRADGTTLATASFSGAFHAGTGFCP